MDSLHYYLIVDLGHYLSSNNGACPLFAGGGQRGGEGGMEPIHYLNNNGANPLLK